MRQNFLTLLFLAVLLAGTVYVVKAYRKPGSMTVLQSQAMDMSTTQVPIGSMPVATETVSSGRLTAAVTYSGSVVAYSDEDVTARVSGTVLRMPVYPGQHVKAGQLLVELDSKELGSRANEAAARLAESQSKALAAGASVERAHRDVDAARSEVHIARIDRTNMLHEVAWAKADYTYWAAELDRAHKLYDSNWLSLAELQQTQANARKSDVELHHRRTGVSEAELKIGKAQAMLAASEAALTQSTAERNAMTAAAGRAQAELQTARVVRDYTRIAALNGGWITERLVSPGTLVSPGMVLLRLKHTDRLRLQARVASQDAAAIRVGAAVTAHLLGRPGEVTARVTSIFHAADPQSRTVTVEALVPGSTSLHLIPGDFLEMRINLAGGGQGAIIPLAALQHDMQGHSFVWLVHRKAGNSATYTCLMHPQVHQDHPGNCPVCGMPLVQKAAGEATAHRQEVAAGADDGSRTLIARGVAAGDEVVVAGFEDLQEGMAVTPTAWSAEGPLELPPPLQHGGH